MSAAEGKWVQDEDSLHITPIQSTCWSEEKNESKNFEEMKFKFPTFTWT